MYMLSWRTRPPPTSLLPTTGTPPPPPPHSPCLAWWCDGWLGHSAFMLTKRTCSPLYCEPIILLIFPWAHFRRVRSFENWSEKTLPLPFPQDLMSFWPHFAQRISEYPSLPVGLQSCRVWDSDTSIFPQEWPLQILMEQHVLHCQTCKWCFCSENSFGVKLKRVNSVRQKAWQKRPICCVCVVFSTFYSITTIKYEQYQKAQDHSASPTAHQTPGGKHKNSNETFLLTHYSFLFHQGQPKDWVPGFEQHEQHSASTFSVIKSTAKESVHSWTQHSALQWRPLPKCHQVVGLQLIHSQTCSWWSDHSAWLCTCHVLLHT